MDENKSKRTWFFNLICSSNHENVEDCNNGGGGNSGDNPNNKISNNSKKRVCLCCENATFPSVWSELREQQELCDGIFLLPSGNKYKVHRTILSASSSYFKASFTYNSNNNTSVINNNNNNSNINNSSSNNNTNCDGDNNNNNSNNNSRQNNDNQTIIKVDVTDAIMNSFLDYAYTGKCLIDWSNVEDLLAAADRYDMIGLIRDCCRFLLRELKPDNCIGIYLYAKHFFCTDLEKYARTFILSAFPEVASESQEFTRINEDELFDILNDEHLNIYSEEIVFDVIKKWIEIDLPCRKKHLPKLLTCVRFGLMPYQTFKEQFMSWPPIKDDPECHKVILPFSSQPRIPHQVIMVVGGWSNGAPTDIIEVYDTRASVWLRMKLTDTKRAYHGVCEIDQKVYVLGGFDGNTHFNSMRCYDPVRCIWEEKACMYQPRCYVSVVVLHRKIYALGGYNGHTRLDSVERYDPDRNQWEMVAPMRRLRSDAGATAVGDNIYVVGGFNGNEVLDSCEMYNSTTNSWTLISIMLSPRSGVGLIACDDYIYAIGGFSGHRRLRSVERYNPKSPAWNFVSEMMCPRSNFASAVVENTIFVIGGFNGTNTISFVEKYDPKQDYWQAATQMNVNRSAQSACVLRGLPNIKGYSIRCTEIANAPCILKRDCLRTSSSNDGSNNLSSSPMNISTVTTIGSINETIDLADIDDEVLDLTWEHGAAEPFFE